MKKRNYLKIAGAAIAVAGIFGIAACASNRKEARDNLDDDNEYISEWSVSDKNTGRKYGRKPFKIGCDGPRHSHKCESTSFKIGCDGPRHSHKYKKGRQNSIYTRYIKRALDVFLSASGLVILLPVFAVISVIIYIDDPGPVIFRQKRVGKDKHFFYCHKFRSMKMSAPHDVPTHQLRAPEQYITRAGRVLRKTSLDEIPQCWDILRGKMSVVGPRPALWNQEELVSCREPYGANHVMPGLTGLAQISGRDELSIAHKAQIDGEYVRKQGFLMDTKCFFGTIASVLKHDGVVEGGTGKMKKSQENKTT